MIWLVLTVVAIFAAVGSVFFAPRGWKVGGPVLVGAVWLVATLFLSVHSVGQRENGIVYNFSGTIAGKKAPGVVMTAPWQHIKTENVGVVKETFSFTDAGLGQAVSRDQQNISAAVAVNYQVEPEHIIKLYDTVGPNWRNILLEGRVPQAFKETTAQFPSAQLTLKRPQLRVLTLSRLRHELGPYGIRVVDVFISNLGYSAEYEAAIETKLRQQQAAQTAEAKVAQVQAEAQQRVAAAKGEAQAIDLEGKALRNNPEVLKLRAISKLNPRAQVIYCNNGDCPTILGTLTTGK